MAGEHGAPSELAYPELRLISHLVDIFHARFGQRLRAVMVPADGWTSHLPESLQVIMVIEDWTAEEGMPALSEQDRQLLRTTLTVRVFPTEVFLNLADSDPLFWESLRRAHFTYYERPFGWAEKALSVGGPGLSARTQAASGTMTVTPG